MKKYFIIIGLFLFTVLGASAEIVDVETDYTTNNLWQKNGIKEEKVLAVGHKILYDNQVDRRVPIVMNINHKIINAESDLYNKKVTVYYGILPYIDNDDELAFVLSHEIAHAREAYNGGVMKLVAIKCNNKKYESDADISAIDMMVKSGYNPIAAITFTNKIDDEALSDWGFWISHPKGSKRLMNIYKYIYKKYPQYLTSNMTQNVNYQNFRYSMNREIRAFEQKEKRFEAKENGEL